MGLDLFVFCLFGFLKEYYMYKVLDSFYLNDVIFSWICIWVYFVIIV